MPVATPDIPTYALKEQRKPEIQNLAKSIKEIGNQIITDNNLETNPESSNLAWIINGEKVVFDPSFSALQLKAAIEQGSLGESRGIKISFRNIEKELGLRNKFGTDVACGLTKEFLQRLGATLPTDRQSWEKVYDREKNMVIISDPRKPFYAECAVNGTAGNGEPNLVGFTIIPKDIELLAAA